MPTVDTRIGAIYPPGTKGGVRAYASVTVDGCLGIQGVRVIEGREGLFVSMPSRKVGDGYKEICFPVTKEFREQLHREVLDAFEQALTQAQAAPAPRQESDSRPESKTAVQQMGSM